MKIRLAILSIAAVIATYADDTAANTKTAENPFEIAPAVIAPAEQEQKSPAPAQDAAPAAEQDAAPEPAQEAAPAAEQEAAPAQETAKDAAPAQEAAKEVAPEKEAEPEAAPAIAQEKKSPALREEGTDEVDLEEIDDSADAAKKPSIKPVTGNDIEYVDISCDEASLADVLRQFRKTTKANIIHDDSTNLQKRVSVELRGVPWLQGLTAILGSRGFRLEERENIYRVMEDVQQIPISTRTFALNHASAKELANLFNASFSRKDASGRVVQPIASSFDGANVVVVSATDKILADCDAIIKAVDKAVAQIYIEARFIELSSEAMHKLGIQWDALESWGASLRGLSAGAEYNNGRAANYGAKLTSSSKTTSTTDSSSKSANTSLSGDTATTSASTSSSPSKNSSESLTYTGLAPSSIGAAVGAGRDAASMAWHNARGFQGQLSVDDFRLALSAFEQMSDAKMFSNPKIIVSNGREARVDMTTKYPNVVIDSNYTGQNSQNLTISTKLDTIPGEDKFMFAKEAFFSWGIQLSVTPRISPDGLISVEIVPTISDCTGYLTVNSSQETDTPYTQYPIIDVKRLTTEFTMKDGATAVIGGLSRTSEEDIDSGIPYLRKIPWIGPKLFGWKSRGKVQKEILVFVTVGIADPANLPRDIGLPKNAIMGREYVSGEKLEPGDRGYINGIKYESNDRKESSAREILKLDMRPIDEQKPKPKGTSPEMTEGKRGTVKITVVPDPRKEV